jgi:hypothetical protein
MLLEENRPLADASGLCEFRTWTDKYLPVQEALV